MIKCSTSLWSADLANLASEIKRIEPHSERFHIDVVDGHYVKNMLFFPDLVKTLRKHTAKPFEIHLMTTDPLGWVGPFIEAGGDIIQFCLDSSKNPSEVLAAIKSTGKRAGISLLVTEPLDLLEPYWQDLDVVVLCCTAMGIKGASMDAGIPDKIRRARELIEKRGLKTEIEVDGGIRRTTVPQMYAAGADFIVPGSLMFGENPVEMRKWLASL